MTGMRVRHEVLHAMNSESQSTRNNQSTIGDRAFTVADPRVRNELQSAVTSASVSGDVKKTARDRIVSRQNCTTLFYLNVQRVLQLYVWPSVALIPQNILFHIPELKDTSPF